MKIRCLIPCFLSRKEYYLEDVIQMLGFVPPLQEKKKRRDEGEDEEEVGEHLKSGVEHCPLSREKYILVDPDWFTP